MKTILVTGGTRGIGLAIARIFQQRGDRVCVTYSKDEVSASLAKEEGVEVFSHSVGSPLTPDSYTCDEVAEETEHNDTDDAGIDVYLGVARELKVVKDACQPEQSEWDKIVEDHAQSERLAVLTVGEHVGRGKRLHQLC